VKYFPLRVYYILIADEQYFRYVGVILLYLTIILMEVTNKCLKKFSLFCIYSRKKQQDMSTKTAKPKWWIISLSWNKIYVKKICWTLLFSNLKKTHLSCCCYCCCYYYYYYYWHRGHELCLGWGLWYALVVNHIAADWLQTFMLHNSGLPMSLGHCLKVVFIGGSKSSVTSYVSRDFHRDAHLFVFCALDEHATALLCAWVL
jgi:hypothetical protein